MKKILLLLAEGFEVWEASVFIDVMGWNLVEGDGTTKLFTCGLKKQVKSAFGQTFVVDYTADQISENDYDALAIPGGFGQFNFYEEAYDKRFLGIIEKFNQLQKPIASICTGALPIARSGALSGRNATTYIKNPEREKSLRDLGVTVVNKPIVVDRNITTSWNPSTAMDVAFLLLENLTSRENAARIKGLMGFATSEL
jgi:protein deglycase